MPTTRERLNETLIELSNKGAMWELNFGNPYARAYDSAFENYQRALEAQDLREQFAADLLVLCASVLTGSVMMAVFAEESIRVLAIKNTRMALFKAKRKRTFDVFRAVSKDRTMTFLFGEGIDQAKAVAKRYVAIAGKKMTEEDNLLLSKSSMNFRTRIKDFILLNQTTLHKFLVSIREDTGMPEAVKLEVVDLVRQGPFFNPPEKRVVIEQRLSAKMELLFYIKLMLDSDKLVRTAVPRSWYNFHEKRNIDPLPSSPNYPKPKRQFASPIIESIEYDTMGSALRSRLDKVHETLYGRPFYTEGNAMRFLGIETNGAAKLRRAEELLNQMAHESQPRSLTNIVSP